jgi:biopolymer transport protein ExbD
MKRKFGFLIKKTNTEVDLNITAMADIMVVLIVFVLRASSNDVLSFHPENNMRLPVAVTEKSIEDHARFEVTKKEVLINGKKVMNIGDDGILRLGKNEVVFILKELQDFEEEQKRTLATEFNRKLLILADEYTPYDTIKKIIDISQMRGFVDYRFVAIKGGE